MKEGRRGRRRKKTSEKEWGGIQRRRSVRLCKSELGQTPFVEAISGSVSYTTWSCCSGYHGNWREINHVPNCCRAVVLCKVFYSKTQSVQQTKSLKPRDSAQEAKPPKTSCWSGVTTKSQVSSLKPIPKLQAHTSSLTCTRVNAQRCTSCVTCSWLNLELHRHNHGGVIVLTHHSCFNILCATFTWCHVVRSFQPFYTKKTELFLGLGFQFKPRSDDSRVHLSDSSETRPANVPAGVAHLLETWPCLEAAAERCWLTAW